MDDIDRQLLLFLQTGIPLQKRPFEKLAVRLGLDSADVLLRISRLKLKKIVRQITAVLEGRALGYENTLAAMIMPPEQVKGALFWMKVHPGITYCIARENEFNLWIGLALPAGMAQDQLRRLRTLAGAKKAILLPVLTRFKGQETKQGEVMESVVSLTPLEIMLLRKVQKDFPLDDEPFRKWAIEIGISEEEVLNILERWRTKGFFKKIKALMPPSSGTAENTILAVWEVPEERQKEVGRSIADFENVLECVTRPAYPEFPYALHTVVSAETHEEAEEILKKISEKVGNWPHRLLGNMNEYKKIRIKYYPEGLEDWESRGLVEIRSMAC